MLTGKRKVLLNPLTFCHSEDTISSDTYRVSGRWGLLGSPAQPHGQVLKTALPPVRSPRRRQPPSVISHLIPLYSPTLITNTWQRQGIPLLSLPLLFCQAAVSLWRSESRKDRLNMHRRSEAAVNFHSPLPAAGVPASLRLLAVPAPTNSVAGCAFFPTALPASHSLTRLAHRLAHPPASTSEERMEQQRKTRLFC